MSILSLQNVCLTLAGQRLLDGVNWSIKERQRIALVGRNGAGKSTLLALLKGDIIPDAGVIHRVNGLSVAGLVQAVPDKEDASVYSFLVQSLGELGPVLTAWRTASLENNVDALAVYQAQMDDWQAWEWLPRIEMMATRLSLALDMPMDQLSGGMKRRVLLAAALIAAPTILLLDEPTNHLDTDAIEWLESYLKAYAGSVVFITHDRCFLSVVATSIVELDRGHLSPYHCDYDTFLDRREALRLSEEKSNQLFDKRLNQEEAWLREGIKARRTRNEGRVRALKAMRREYEERRLRVGTVTTAPPQGDLSGEKVLEATGVHYSLRGQILIRDFSLLLMRGAKVGLIGPNGCGKTTLVRLLLRELAPDSGDIRHGTALSVAYFDQLRQQLNESETLLRNVGEGSDYVMIQGQQKHVTTYLKSFLFSNEQFNQPISVLSGGERNRLLLAKLFSKPVNFLVMDEPTNDLDIETLTLLESLLVAYKGTLLLISHDRTFVNNVVTSIVVYEGEGHFKEYVGGYDSYRLLKKQRQEQGVLPKTTSSQRSRSSKLGYNEQRELQILPQKIEQLEQLIEQLQNELATACFYNQEMKKMVEFKKELKEKEQVLADYYSRWSLLEKKNG